MFDRRPLPDELDAVRDAHAPGAIVLDCEEDFGALRPSVAENLLAIVDDVDPISHDEAWVPADAPGALDRLAGGEFTVGMPGDGGVAWTRQTDPPVVFVKPRLGDSPSGFVEFLIAEALVEIGVDRPETVLGHFRDEYSSLDAAVPLSATDTYQVAVALFDAYVGLHTRPEFRSWSGEHDALYGEWVDAGERLEPRLADITGSVSAGRTGFADATELACSALKHGIEVPSPFAALDDDAHRKHGAAFALKWAERTFETIDG